MQTKLQDILNEIDRGQKTRWGDSLGYPISPEDFCSVIREGKEVGIVDRDRPGADAGHIHQLSIKYSDRTYALKTWTQKPWAEAFQIGTP